MVHTSRDQLTKIRGYAKWDTWEISLEGTLHSGSDWHIKEIILEIAAREPKSVFEKGGTTAPAPASL